MKLLLSYIKSYRDIVISALLLATVNRIFSLLDPQIFRVIVDRYASRAAELSSRDFLAPVRILLTATIGVAFVSRVAKTFQDYYVNVITQKVGAKLYAHTVTHSFSLPYAAFEDQRSGELLQKMQRARDDVKKLIVGMIDTVFFSAVGILFVLGYAFFVHWSVGLVYFAIIPVLGYVTFVISRNIKTAQTAIVRESADLAGSTTETLRNVQLVKSLGLEEQEVNRLNSVNEAILQLELKKVRLVEKMLFVQGTLINFLRSALMLLMLYLIFTGSMTLGEFFSLLFYSFFIFNPLADLGNVIVSYQEARASMEQVEEVLRLPSELKPAKPKKISTLREITFENVSFRYASAAQSAVRGISFRVNSAQTAAFVGPSGSGKTTLLKLLSSLYHPVDGVILFNGVDARNVDVEALRKRIGLVAQETQLFAGTIRENLTFVRPEANDEECVQVMQAAAAGSILARAGKGLDTKIGEGGLKLSGGERQRLAIARALLRRPDLIVFDEATSSLDSITEREITKTIQIVGEENKHLMTILVAHRLSTIAHADTIYVLEKGAIIESGSHDELVRRLGLYAAMWREQGGAKN